MGSGGRSKARIFLIVVSIFMTLAAMGLGAAFGYFYITHKRAIQQLQQENAMLKGDVHMCPDDVKYQADDSEYDSVFNELSVAEMDAVVAYLEGTGLNIVPSDQATVANTSIFLVEKMTPQKGDVLDRLRGANNVIERQARVILATPEGTAEYIVGPVDKPTYHMKAHNPKWKTPTWTDRPVSILSDEKGMYTALVRETEKVKEILLESFDGFSMGADCGAKCFTFLFALPQHVKEGERSTWLWLLRKVEGYVMHPVAFQMLLNMTDTDEAKWNTIAVWYNNQMFSSPEQLLEKYKSGTVTKIIQKYNPNDLYSTLKRRQNEFTTSAKSGPGIYYPDGQRFKVSGRKVEWLNWNFEFSFRTSRGPQLHNILFNNERIVYELSTQEIAVIYAGANPALSHNILFDGVVLIGPWASPLVPGVDCPQGATYFNTTSFWNGEAKVYPNSQCLFEYKDNVPLRRHYENNFVDGFQFYGGMHNNVLVLRTILAVYNYDYVVDFLFYQNGVIQTRVTPTGYTFNEFYSGSPGAGNGYNIYPNVVPALHQHLFHFKVDLDVHGEANRHSSVDIKVESEPAQFYPGAETNQRIYKQKAFETLKRTEKEAAARFKLEEPKLFLFYNENNKNQWGSHKAYSIDVQGASKLLYPDTWARGGATSWAKYQLAVTKHNDDEDYSSTTYNSMNKENPVLNFDSYIDDNQPIVDQDLVAWVTVGLQHLPNTQDVPVTTTAGSAQSFYIKPFNYFNEDPSMASHDNVYIKPSQEGGVMVEQNANNEQPSCAPRLTKLSEYAGQYGHP